MRRPPADRLPDAKGKKQGELPRHDLSGLDLPQRRHLPDPALRGAVERGALAGAAVGSATEQAATKDTAYEFMVQKSTGNVISVVQTNELGLRPGDNVILVQIDGTTRIRAKY